MKDQITLDCYENATFSHIKNLILLANLKDGIQPHERQLIEAVIERESSTDGKLEKGCYDIIYESLNSHAILVEGRNLIIQNVSVVPPQTDRKAVLYLYDMVCVMLAGDCAEGAENFCREIALRFGFKKEIITQLIEIVKKSLEKVSSRK